MCVCVCVCGSMQYILFLSHRSDDFSYKQEKRFKSTENNNAMKGFRNMLRMYLRTKRERGITSAFARCLKHVSMLMRTIGCLREQCMSNELSSLSFLLLVV